MDKDLLADYDKKNAATANCVALCKSCHGKTNHNHEYWQSYFEEAFIEMEIIAC